MSSLQPCVMHEYRRYTGRNKEMLKRYGRGIAAAISEGVKGVKRNYQNLY
jgi:hypothetical protein